MPTMHPSAPTPNTSWLRQLWQQGRDTLARQRADHRVMLDGLQASGRDLHDAAGLADLANAAAAHWGRFPEQLPDGRGTRTHLRHS